jgi:hypothetical protein
MSCSAVDNDSAPPTHFLFTGVADPVSQTRDSIQFITPALVDGATLQLGCFTAPEHPEYGSVSTTLTVAPAPDLDGDRESDYRDDDDDNDGYADFYETLLGFDPRNAASRPLGVDPAARGVDFTADHDGDGMPTWLEGLGRSDPLNPQSRAGDRDADGIPDVIDRNGVPDGYAPWNIAAGRVAARVDISSGAAQAGLDVTVGDLTGVSRAWSHLELQGEDPVKHRLVIDSGDALKGVLAATRLQTPRISAHAPPGTWSLANAYSIDTLWNVDRMGFRVFQDFSWQFEGTGVVDNEAPAIHGFAVLGGPVDAGLGGQQLGFRVDASDTLSEISGAEIELFNGPHALWLPVASPAQSGSFDLYSGILPTAIRAQTWQITRLTVYDTAGNFTALDYAALVARGFPTGFVINNSSTP